MTKDPAETLMSAATSYKQHDDQYGGWEETQSTAADIASTLMGVPFSPHQIALVMMAVKLARIAKNPGHQDSYMDLVNYTAFAAALAPTPGVKGGGPKAPSTPVPPPPRQRTPEEVSRDLAFANVRSTRADTPSERLP